MDSPSVAVSPSLSEDPVATVVPTRDDVEAPPRANPTATGIPAPAATQVATEVGATATDQAEIMTRSDTPTPAIPVSDDRVFIMDADLGYASLSLGYIVYRPIRPFAEINGNDVYEGSEVEGFLVEKIEVDRVVLRDDRGPLVLRVP
jgi:hypothetical protein